MSNRHATLVDWQKLRDNDRDRLTTLLDELDRLQLSCRCEMVDGKDFTIVVAPGYARARYWLDQYDLT